MPKNTNYTVKVGDTFVQLVDETGKILIHSRAPSQRYRDYTALGMALIMFALASEYIIRNKYHTLKEWNARLKQAIVNNADHERILPLIKKYQKSVHPVLNDLVRHQILTWSEVTPKTRTVRTHRLSSQIRFSLVFLDK